MPSNVHSNPFIIDPPADLLTRYPGIKRNSHALAMKYAFGQMVEEEDLKLIGGQLWQVLALDDSLKGARAAAGRQILPMMIRSNNSALLQLPWETLYHPDHHFLGRNPAFTLSRHLNQPASGSDRPEAMPGPLRILLFTSLPDDVDPERSRLDVEQEQAEVQAALTPWIAKGTVVLEMPDDGRLATLKDYLKHFDPHLLFLSGHGKFYGEPHRTDHYAAFAFEDDHGHTHSVRGEELAQAFIGSRVRAVVLSACESGQSPSDALNVGLARRLSLLGIPHVIGMRESVLDVAGIQFARALADAVAGGERLDVALQAARQAIIKP
ncbi:MAG TPA: CHAT domain-containing protein, partial [Anaerolineae bacterium]|nr:CHAT domain-containing protein [Anaerolineae bacterium]